MKSWKTAKANIRWFDILKRRLSWKCEFVQFFLLANMEPDPGQLIKPELISGQSTLNRSPDIRTAKQNCSDREKVKVEMSEGKLSAVWDRCLADGIVKTGAGDKICQPLFTLFDKICQTLLLCLSTAPWSFLHPDVTAIWFCDYSPIPSKHHRRRLGFFVLSGSLQEEIVAGDLWAWNRLWHCLLKLPTWGFWFIIALVLLHSYFSGAE